jgi:ubiquinone/menaquinone biosynthesis C-methylase UbiE
MAKLVRWAEIAEWFDAKMGDEGDLWHREIIDPGLIDLVGEVRGLRLLDLGCGNGYLARRFARLGAKVSAVDASAPVVALAQRRQESEPLGIDYHVHDAARLPMFQDGSFEVVYSNMALMDMASAEGAIRETARVLAPGGRFVASLCHPCFDVPNASSWLMERKDYATSISRRVGRYREPFETETLWKPVDRPEFTTMSYHRPVSWYARTLWKAGLAITALDEPDGSDRARVESPQGWAIHEVPLHLVIEARKLGGAASPAPRKTRRRSERK